MSVLAPTRAAAAEAAYIALREADHGATLLDVASIQRGDTRAEVSVLEISPVLAFTNPAGDYVAELTRYAIDCGWRTATPVSRMTYKNSTIPQVDVPASTGGFFVPRRASIARAVDYACDAASPRPNGPVIGLTRALSSARERFKALQPALPVGPRRWREGEPWGPPVNWTPDLELVLREGSRGVFVERNQLVRQGGSVRVLTFWVADADSRSEWPSYAARPMAFDCTEPLAEVLRDVTWPRYGFPSDAHGEGSVQIDGSRPLAALRKAACEGAPSDGGYSSFREAADALKSGG